MRTQALVQFNELGEEFTRQQSEFLKLYADLGNREIEALRNNKNPTDMLAAQFDIAKVFSAESIDQSRATFVLMMNGVGKMMACLDWSKKESALTPSIERAKEPTSEDTTKRKDAA